VVQNYRPWCQTYIAFKVISQQQYIEMPGGWSGRAVKGGGRKKRKESGEQPLEFHTLFQSAAVM